MKNSLYPKKFVYLDTTYLRFAQDKRGIPQVALEMVELFQEPYFKERMRYVAYPDVFRQYLRPLGVSESEIFFPPAFPILGKIERYHGLGVDWRYREIRKSAAAFIHPEMRTVLSHAPRQTVWLHDFIEMERRNLFKWDRFLYFRMKFRFSAAATDFLAHSKSTCQAAGEWIPSLNPARIQVLPLGVRPSLKMGGSIKKSQPNPILALCVGSYEVRKNIPAMIRNLEKIFGNNPFKLSLVGHIRPDQRAETEAIIRRSGYADSVRILGLVEDEDLAQLYAESHALLFPSHQEGFGLPLVEAMLNGLWVFAFQNSSIPEVLGDGGIIKKNDDFSGWGEELASLITDDEKGLNQSCLARSRAEYFSPEKARARMRDFFKPWVELSLQP